MKPRVKSMLVITSVLVALVLTAVGALAAPGLSRAAGPRSGAAAGSEAEAALAACKKMKAGDVYWYHMVSEDEAEVVEEYPDDALVIAPAFEYTCVPKNTKITTVLTLEGESVFTDKESVKASTKKGEYVIAINNGEDPIPAGNWGVEFYNNKTLLTSGEIVVGAACEEGDEGCDGGNGGDGDTVSVEGSIGDKRTKKGIKGAVFIVLNPGESLEEWIEAGQPEESVYTFASTDSKGKFVLEDPLERNQPYAVIAAAKGYKWTGSEEFAVSDEDEDPLVLNILLTK